MPARTREREACAMTNTQYVETIVIGGGQAGLAVGYHLRRQQWPFIILDANARVGDAWRNRWDSLRLFSPARFDGLDGLPFPAADFAFPTKDEMADYLEGYATTFELPVKTRTRVERLWRSGNRFQIEAASGETFEADNVVVAMANYQRPRTPEYAAELAPRVTQLHSSAYRSHEQLQPGPVLVVGFGNSGAEIALDVARTHQTFISGRDTGSIPFRIDGSMSRLFLAQVVFRGVFHRLLTLDTPMGKRAARAQAARHTTPLIRVLPSHLAAAGVEHVGRTIGVRDGVPVFDDGRTLDEVSNVIWCTGYLPSFDWIDLPVHGEHGPLHARGVCTVQPGLYFVGLHFLYAMSSSMVQGVSRDAARVARAIAGAHQSAPAPAANATGPRRATSVAVAAGHRRRSSDAASGTGG
jgi:putative flavoprotein involved in K+ transport